MPPKYEIKICSDLDYNMLIAEIYFDKKFLVLISQKEGSSNLKIEFPKLETKEDNLFTSLDLNTFEGALQAAKAKLLSK
jgi:hypothetical protein